MAICGGTWALNKAHFSHQTNENIIILPNVYLATHIELFASKWIEIGMLNKRGI